MMYGKGPQDMYGQPQHYEPYQKKGLDSCGQCVKYLMFAMNFIFFLLACAVLGLGIYFLVDKSFIGETFGTVLATVASWLLIISGAVVFLIAFLGCIGALNENKFMLILYFVTLMVLFILSLTGAILGIVFHSQIGERVRTEMTETLRNEYGVKLEHSYNQAITHSWDKMQTELYCCSVDDSSWAIYRGSEWYKIQPGVPEHSMPFVPPSCCKKDQYGKYIDKQKCQTWNQGPPGKQSGIMNEGLFYTGCYERGKQFIKDVSGYIIGFGIAMAICMLAGMFFSFFLFRQL
ncbi:hypothetical protein CAPTEDRAFT_149515 [Capitella teleta]|uniref:Tetraspanin n=1 Tax=Capitella teleta TaxID=283909 RepID=R7VAK9_CAPTE|nr:hypothetical protein CAPTEDRAFT_149515 [Capitella teleta]|eukprot:ELU13376.1 hypothetical protein CAPTEDRAFT_149515 [Capitella teleta]